MQNYQAESDLADPHRPDVARLEGVATGGRRLARRPPATNRDPMARYVLKRLGLAVITLVLLSMIVFARGAAPARRRRSLGARARTPSSEAVAEYNHEHGTDRPRSSSTVDWAGGVVRGDLGKSLVPPEQPVWDVIEPALVNSLKLAVFAFVLVVPFGILGGVLAGLRVGKADRSRHHGRRALARRRARVRDRARAHPRLLDLGSAGCRSPPSGSPGAGPLTQVKYLTLPAIALALVLFGYVARITRAGVVEALDADYTRTAYLKGLPRQDRHPAPRAAQRAPPDDRRHRDAGRLPRSAASSRSSYLFNYHGIGLTTLEAAQQKDYTVLSAGVLIIGFIYLVVTLVADILSALLNPRIRFEASE